MSVRDQVHHHRSQAHRLRRGHTGGGHATGPGGERRPRRPAFYSLHWAAAAKVPDVNELDITIALRTMAEANGVLCQVSRSLHWTAGAKVLDAKELDIAITLGAMAETNGVPFQVFDSVAKVPDVNELGLCRRCGGWW